MRLVVLTVAILSPLAGCGPTPHQKAFAAQVEAQCQAGDMVACHQRDGDTVEVARLEVACSAQNLQACQAVSNYRVQQQQIQQQQNLAAQQSMDRTVQNSYQMAQTQYPVFQAPQVQPIQLDRGSNHYYCNQLGSYVIACR